MRARLVPEVKRIGDIARETVRDLAEFEAWRNNQPQRLPDSGKKTELVFDHILVKTIQGFTPLRFLAT